MQQKAFRLFAAAIGIDHLRFLDWREGGEGEGLGFAALKNGRAMRAWQHPNFAADLTQILIAASIHPLLSFQHTDAKRLYLDVVEGLGNSEIVRLGIFLKHRRLHFFAQGFDCLGARNFSLRVKGALNAIARNLIRNLEQLRLYAQQRHLSLWLANLCRQFFLRTNHLARVSLGELQCFYELRFWQFIGGAFDHDDIVFRADINQIEIALNSLGMGRIRDELAVHSPNADRADRPLEWNVRNAERGRRSVHRQNIGIIFPIRTEQNGNDLGVVEITLREERAQWPVGHPRSERFLFRRTPFAFKITAREFSRGGRFLAVINRQREKVLTFLNG